MKTKILITLVMTVFLILGCNNKEEEKFKITAILSLTGSGGSIGNSIKNGLILAKETINNKDGINGKKVEINFLDNKTNTEIAKSIFLNEEENYKPNLYITNLSFIAMTLKSYAEEYKVPLLGLAVSSPKFTENSDYCFKYHISIEEETDISIRDIRKNNIDSLLGVYLNDDYGQEIISSIERKLEQSNVEFKKISFENNENNFEKIIEEANRSNIDGIYFAGFPSHINFFLKQLDKIEFSGEIFGASGFSNIILQNMSFEKTIHIPSSSIYNERFIYGKEMKEKYESKFDMKYDIYSASGYDLLKMVQENLNRESVTKREKIRDVMENDFIHSGVFGIIKKFKGEHNIYFPIYKAKLINGKIEFGNED